MLPLNLNFTPTRTPNFNGQGKYHREESKTSNPTAQSFYLKVIKIKLEALKKTSISTRNLQPDWNQVDILSAYVDKKLDYSRNHALALSVQNYWVKLSL